MPETDPTAGPTDPTALTTQALLREVEHVRIEMKNEVANIATRIDAMDKAVELFKDDLVRVPTEVQREVGNLRDRVNIQIEAVKDVSVQQFRVVDEKLSGVGKQFQLNEIALNAALSAAKEAVGKQSESITQATSKSETNATKLMDQMRDIVNTANAALNDKYDEGRNRMTALEGRMVGLLQSVAQLQTATPPTPPVVTTSSLPMILSAVGIAVSVAILAVVIIIRLPS